MPDYILIRIEIVAEYFVIAIVLLRSIWAVYNYRKEVKESERKQETGTR